MIYFSQKGKRYRYRGSRTERREALTVEVALTCNVVHRSKYMGTSMSLYNERIARPTHKVMSILGYNLKRCCVENIISQYDRGYYNG